MKKLIILSLLLVGCSTLSVDLLNNISSTTTKSSEIKLIVPFYDLSYGDRIYKAAENTRMAVILNPNEGAGKNKDSYWVKAISKLSKVDKFGYIDMVTWNGNKSTLRSKGDLNKEIENWKNWYGITSFFFDDWSEKCSLPQSVRCIANPGFNMNTPANYTVVWESEKYITSKDPKKSNTIIISMRDNDYLNSFNLAKSRKASMFYAVEAKDDWSAYDKLPSYFEEMCKLFQ